jgi:hypothetical protein
MASRAETTAVYGAGLVQGIVLVTFPAASTVFKDPAEYDLSSTQYAGPLPPASDHRDRRRAARCRLEQQVRNEARLPGGTRRQPALDGPAHRQPILHVGRGRRLRAPPPGHGLPGSRLRPHRARREHPRRRLPPEEREPCDPGPERPAGTRHRPGPGVRRHRRPRLLVGTAGDVGDAVARAAGRERGAYRFKSKRHNGPQGGPGPRFREASSCPPSMRSRRSLPLRWGRGRSSLRVVGRARPPSTLYRTRIGNGR